jgi:protein TonB
MLNNLLESKAKKQRSTAGTVTSVILHTVLLAGAVYATAQATIEAEKPKEEKVEFVEMKKDEPPPPKNEPPPPPPPEAVAAPPPPKGFQVLTAPVEIPTSSRRSTSARRSSTRPTSRARAWPAARPRATRT